MQRGETIPKFTEQACYEIYQAPVCQRDTNEVSAAAAMSKQMLKIEFQELKTFRRVS
jgi:hypothetical protein